jgi:hypothetical protein
MMHGTLEIKRDVFAEASALQKPEWLIGDKIPPVSELTESQAKELDIYLEKAKAFQEEQAACRKTLELEMKKLKNEIADVSKSYDDKLDELAKLKVLVNREILSHELYISKIALNMVKTEQTRKALKKAENDIQTLRKENSVPRLISLTSALKRKRTHWGLSRRRSAKPRRPSRGTCKISATRPSVNQI